MVDPVLTKSGHTYERETLQESLQKAGKFDPVTREPITSRDALLPNMAIKRATQNFLRKNPWAYDNKSEYEDYLNINF